uniref:Uncharacterized protein n=1 Tax=Lactuca sativa TaxID=4236 RepID=A0A9R1VUU4_LACSA|nr:hypothetical protein LSAT_V11C400162480 [Lactuca sativa]
MSLIAVLRRFHHDRSPPAPPQPLPSLSRFKGSIFLIRSGSDSTTKPSERKLQRLEISYLNSVKERESSKLYFVKRSIKSCLPVCV